MWNLDEDEWLDRNIDEQVDRLAGSDWETAAQAICRTALSPTRRLCELVGTRSADVNQRIAIILGRISSPHVIPTLAALVEDDDPANSMPRIAAIRALQRIGTLEALDIIEGAAATPGSELARVKGEAVKRLQAQLAPQTAAGEGDIATEHGDEPIAPGILPLNELTQESVRELVGDELNGRLAVNRFELVQTISRKFGREYLIRVRQYVNRYIYLLASTGAVRIEEDCVIRNH